MEIDILTVGTVFTVYPKESVLAEAMKQLILEAQRKLVEPACVIIEDITADDVTGDTERVYSVYLWGRETKPITEKVENPENDQDNLSKVRRRNNNQ